MFAISCCLSLSHHSSLLINFNEVYCELPEEEWLQSHLNYYQAEAP